MKLGERLFNLRKEKNLSQEEVANILGVSRQTISKWETDQSVPDLDKVIPLCELYGINSEELLTGNKKEEVTIIKEDNKNNSRKALVVSLSVGLYILSLITALVCNELGLPDFITGSAFFTLIGIATMILVYYFVKHSKDETKEKEEKNSVKEITKTVASLIFTVIYFYISFTTNMWHITWLIWIIFAVVDKIIDLIFLVRGVENEEK